MKYAGSSLDAQFDGNRRAFYSNFRLRYINTVGGNKPDQWIKHGFCQLDPQKNNHISLNGKLYVVLQELPWESRIFKCPCWNAHIGISSKNNARSIARKLSQTGIIWVRISSQHMNWIKGFCEEGFELLTEMVNFELNITRMSSIPLSSHGIRWARRKDIPELEALTHRLFVYDRFHCDPKLPSRLSDRAHAEWIKNAVLEKVADVTLVAVSNGKILGFHALKWMNIFKQRMGMTVLIGVSPRFKGQGVGMALLGKGLQILKKKNLKKVWVRTEAKNIAANRLYTSFGFHETNRFWYLRKINP